MSILVPLKLLIPFYKALDITSKPKNAHLNVWTFITHTAQLLHVTATWVAETCVYFIYFIYLCAFVGFGTISNCSMHSYGSFKYEGLSLDNAAKCLYTIPLWYFEELLYMQYMRQPM